MLSRDFCGSQSLSKHGGRSHQQNPVSHDFDQPLPLSKCVDDLGHDGVNSIPERLVRGITEPDPDDRGTGRTAFGEWREILVLGNQDRTAMACVPPYLRVSGGPETDLMNVVGFMPEAAQPTCQAGRKLRVDEEPQA